MTILLVLGLFAGLYAFWLLFRLATFALPLYAGLGIGFWLLHHGHGIAASILTGFGAGIVTMAAGQFVFGFVHAPLPRLAIALAFVLPAGFAGYQAAHGLAGLALGNGIGLTLLSLGGGAFIARSAWRRLVAPDAEITGPTYRTEVNGADLT